MHKLQVEELEPRQLLSGMTFSPQSQPQRAQPAAAGTCTAQGGQRSPSLTAGPGPQANFPDSTTPAGPTRGSLSRSFDGRNAAAPAARASAPQNPAAVRPVARAGDDSRSSADQQRAGPDGAGPDTAGLNGAALAEAARAEEALAAAAAEQLNPQSSSSVENVADTPGVRPEVQGFTTAGSLVRAGREGEGIVSSPGKPLPSPPTPNPAGGGGAGGRETPAPGSDLKEQEPPDGRLVLPSPQMAGVLTVLPSVSLSALELGMQQFLAQLERVGQGLARDRDGGELWPWAVAGTVAGAAALTAGEIARRQLRRPPGEGTAGPHPDDLFVEWS
jgi:hypothetical protein